MARQIDERVVQMQFDNKQFEAGVATTLSSLDKLREKLKLEGVNNGLKDVEKAANQIDLSGMGKAADAVTLKFDAMSVAAITAISNIVNRATDAGIQLAKSLSTDQIMAGFDKYTQKSEAVQTIMNATGLAVDEVSTSLEKLQWFTDETSYNFVDMVSNIAKFTNQKVPLDEAISSIQGIALVAADAGANATEASRAMYNFSQALGTGAVKLIDWKSIENANMATVTFKETIMDSAVELGTLLKTTDGYKTAVKGTTVSVTDFNSALAEGWFTSDVLLKTLGKYSEYADYIYEISDAFNTAADAMEYAGDMGMTLGARAFKAGQQARTFTDAINATKDAVSSGWMQTFEIIFGNYTESVELWTGFTNTLWDIFASGAEARNDLFQEWKDMGGRDIALEAIANAWENILAVVEPVRKAIREIFPPRTPEGLLAFTKAIRDLTEQFHLSEAAANTLRVVIKALLIPFKVIITAVKIAGMLFVALSVKAFQLVDSFLALWSTGNPIADFFTKLLGAERAERMFAALNKIVERLGNAFRTMRDRVVAAFRSLTSGDNSKAAQILRGVYDILAPIANFLLDRMVAGIEKIANFDYAKAFNTAKDGLSVVTDKIKSFVGAIIPSGSSIIGIFRSIGSVIKNAFSSNVFVWLKDQLSSVSPILSGLVNAFQALIGRLTPAKILAFAFGTALVSTFLSIAKAANSFSNIMSGASGILSAIQNRLKPNKFALISKSLLLLAVGLIALSLVDADRLKQATTSMLFMMSGLLVMTGAMAAIEKLLLNGENIKTGLKSVAGTMIALAAGILALSLSVGVLAKVEWSGIFKGITTIVALMAALVGFSTIMATHSEKISKGSLYIIAFALGIKILVSALNKVEKLDLTNTSKQLFTLVSVILAMVAVAKVVQGVKFSNATGMILMITSLAIFIKMLRNLANNDFSEILSGILFLLPIILAIKLLCKAIGTDKKYFITIGGTILAISVAMLLLVQFMKQLKSLDFGTIVAGTVTIAGITLLMAALTKLMESTKKSKNSKNFGKELLLMSAAMLVLSAVIKIIGNFTTEEIVKGISVVLVLGAMFGALILASKNVKKATGSVVAMTVAIGIITSALMLLTLFSWDELMRATVSLGAILLAFGVAMRGLKAYNFKTILKNVILMVAVFGTIVTAFKILSDIDGKNTLYNAASMSLVLIALGASTKLLDSTAAKLKNVAKTVGSIAIFAAGMMGVFLLLNHAKVDGKNAILNAIAMGIAVNALSVSTKLIGSTKAKWENVAKTVGSVAIFTAGMMGVFLLLDRIDGKNAIPNAIAISLAVAALALSTNFLSGESKSIGASVAGAAGLAIVAGLLAGVLWLIKDVNGLNAIGNAIALSVMVATLATVIAILGNIDVNVGFVAKLGLAIDAIVAILEVLIWLNGAINDWTEGKFGQQLEDGIDLMVKVFTGIGDAIGGLVGGIIGGALEPVIDSLIIAIDKLLSIKKEDVQGLISLAEAFLIITEGQLLQAISGGGLRKFGIELAAFVGPFTEFLEGITETEVTSQDIETAGNAAKMLAEFATSLPDDSAFSKVFSHNKSLSDFAAELNSFTPEFKEFMDSISGLTVTDEDISKADRISRMLSGFATSLPEEGVFKKVFGSQNKSLKDFAEELKAFIVPFRDYMDSISGITVSYGDITKANIISSMLSGFATSLPEEGVFKKVFGSQNKSLKDFAEEMNSFTPAFKTYVDSIAGIDITNEDISKSTNAAMSLAGFATALPETSLWDKVFGGQNKSLEDFANELNAFAPSFVGYYNALKEGDFDSDFVTQSANAALVIAEFATAIANIPTGTNDWQTLDLTTFGTSLANFGEKYASYASKLENVKTDIVSKNSDAIRVLVDIATDLGNNTAWGWLSGKQDLGDFGSNLNALGQGIFDYSEFLKQSEFSNFETAVTSLNNLIDVCMRMNSDFEPNAVTNFSGTMQLVAREGITAFVSTFTGANEDLQKNAYDFIDNFTWYMESQDCKDLLKEVGEWTILRILSSMRSYIEDNAGIKARANELTEAFVAAIKERSDILESMGATMVSLIGRGIKMATEDFDAPNELAKITINRAKSAFGINSPSKAFEEIGMYLVAGLNKGLSDNQSALSTTVVNMGRSVLNSFRSFFGIHSPSVVMRDEVGRYLVMGLAEGITTDTSAEEAAQKKAQNIINAFKTELDKFSLDISTSDLEFELWQALNPNATESDISMQKLDLISQKLEAQAKKVQLADAEYQTTLSVFGEGAEETQEAYNKYLQEQITMAGYAKELSEMQASAVAANKAAYDNYITFLRENREISKEMGMSSEELQEWARAMTGYDPSKPVRNVNVSDIKSIMDEYISNVEVEIDTATATAVQAGLTSGTASGASAAAGAIGGIPDNYIGPALDESYQSMLEELKNGWDNNDIEEELTTTWGGGLISVLENVTDTGNAYIDGKKREFVQTFCDWMGIGGDATTEISSAATTGALEVANDSLSAYASYMNTTGSAVITDTTTRAYTGWTSDMNSYYYDAGRTSGEYIAEGVQDGIDNKASFATTAIRNLANSVKSTFSRALAIESPSKVFAGLGDYIVQGLANGITDNVSLVDDASLEMADETIYGVTSAVSRIRDLIESGLDSDPVIRPVVDMSEVEDSADEVNRIFGGKSFSMSRTVALAKSVAASRNDVQNGRDSSSGVTNNYTFNQTNTSPKALNASTIYRQTKNQFSQLKGATTR